jgi:benzoyl-CoA reductase/2-hydroxyglutaryl-CoA dehydratase subunit BcrC/BadD/HgdB
MGVLKEISVLIIDLDLDCGDERNFSETQLWTRLEPIIEML